MIKNISALLASIFFLVSVAWAESEKFGSIEFSGGLYQPQNEILKKFVRPGGAPGGLLKVGWEIHDLFSLRGSAGYFEEKNQGQFLTGDPSQIETYKVRIIPADLSAIFRFLFINDQLLVPYLGGGGDYYYFMQERSDGGDKLNGGKRGYHAMGGIKILLDYFDKVHAAKLDDEYGINNTYINVEAKYAVVNNWGDKTGFVFTGLTFSGGLLFEF